MLEKQVASTSAQAVLDRLDPWFDSEHRRNHVFFLFEQMMARGADHPEVQYFAAEIVLHISQLESPALIEADPMLTELSPEQLLALSFRSAIDDILQQPSNDSTSDRLLNTMEEAEEWLAQQRCNHTRDGRKVFSTSVMMSACPEIGRPSIYNFINELELVAIPALDVVDFQPTGVRPPNFYYLEDVRVFLERVVTRRKRRKTKLQPMEDNDGNVPSDGGAARSAGDEKVELRKQSAPPPPISRPTINKDHGNGNGTRRPLIKPAMPRVFTPPNSSTVLTEADLAKPGQITEAMNTEEYVHRRAIKNYLDASQLIVRRAGYEWVKVESLKGLLTVAHDQRPEVLIADAILETGAEAKLLEAYQVGATAGKTHGNNQFFEHHYLPLDVALDVMTASVVLHKVLADIEQLNKATDHARRTVVQIERY